MTINQIDMLKHEFIGRQLEIVKSSNKTLVGVKGKIIDETKNTFDIETAEDIKRVLKNVVFVKINFGAKNAVVDGKLLVARPEDRLKKKFKI
jgi:ribonuclease P protein subunit POP4